MHCVWKWDNKTQISIEPSPDGVQRLEALRSIAIERLPIAIIESNPMIATTIQSYCIGV